MTNEDWAQLVKMITGLGLSLISLDKEEGVLVLRVPMSARTSTRRTG